MVKFVVELEGNGTDREKGSQKHAALPPIQSSLHINITICSFSPKAVCFVLHYSFHHASRGDLCVLPSEIFLGRKWHRGYKLTVAGLTVEK